MIPNNNNEPEKEKHIPLWKRFLLYFVIIFGSLTPILFIIVVIGKADLLEVLINTAIGVAVFTVVLMLFIKFVIEKWWDRLDWKIQEKYRNFGGALLAIIIFILWPLGMFGGSSWGGTGAVNLFPIGADSKNYRVDAEITVHPKLFWQKEYTIDSVEWPNGGTSYFSNCELTKDNKLCEDDEGREWTVEIAANPEYDAPSDY